MLFIEIYSGVLVQFLFCSETLVFSLSSLSYSFFSDLKGIFSHVLGSMEEANDREIEPDNGHVNNDGNEFYSAVFDDSNQEDISFNFDEDEEVLNTTHKTSMKKFYSLH